MTPAHAVKLGSSFQKTNVGAWKIDSLAQDIYGMVIACFLVHDKLRKI